MSLFPRYTPAKPAKVAKVGPVSTPLSVEEVSPSSLSSRPDLPEPTWHKPDGNFKTNLTLYEQQLADEAERRDDFCNTHRKMLGGSCQHYNVTKGVEPGDRTAALNGCLLWRLVNAGRKVERVDTVEIVGAITVGDVLRWVSVNAKDLEALRRERRLLLTCAESLQSAGNFWVDTS